MPTAAVHNPGSITPARIIRIVENNAVDRKTRRSHVQSSIGIPLRHRNRQVAFFGFNRKHYSHPLLADVARIIALCSVVVGEPRRRVVWNVLGVHLNRAISGKGNHKIIREGCRLGGNLTLVTHKSLLHN